MIGEEGTGRSAAALGGEPTFESLLPIVRPELPSFDELSAPMREVIRSRMVTDHKYVRQFERALAETLEVRHAICLSSCTSERDHKGLHPSVKSRPGESPGRIPRLAAPVRAP